MKPRSVKCNSSPPSSIYFSLLSFLTPFTSSAKDLKTQVAESSRPNATWAKQEASSIQASSTLVIVGSKRLETIHIVPFPFWAQIHAAFKRQPHVLCSSVAAFSTVTSPLSFHSLSLLFQGKLTLRLRFHFLSTHWLLQILCDSKHSPPCCPLRISTSVSHRSQITS